MFSQNMRLLRQVIPVLIGSLLAVSFGTMVGWPSIAFPILVDPENSPILITWDDSAVLAGSLMIGYIVGTAFSAITIYGNKTGILLSLCCQIAGWMVMFYAHEIFEIGVSRALIGLGNGFGSQQLKSYAQETCSLSIFQLLMQYMPISLNVGIILVYSLGSFVTFRVLSLVCVTIPTLALLSFAAVPKNVNNYCVENRLEPLRTIYQGEKSLKNEKVEEENQAVKNNESNQIGFVGAFKNKKIRNNFYWLFFLTSIPQYTGGTANIAYSQVVYKAALNPYPKLCPVIYAVVFLFSNIAALKYSKRYRRKPVLLGSCIISSVLLILVCLYFYYLLDLVEISNLFTWSPLCLLVLFNLFHTMGVNIIPLLFINDKFPENAKHVASKFYIIYSSLSGIISTKIFQFLFTYHGMYTAYIYFSAVGISSTFIIIFFVKESRQSQEPKIINDFHIETTLPSRNNDNIPQNYRESDKTLTQNCCLENSVILEDEIMTRKL